MKNLKLITFNNGKVETTHEANLPDTHAMFAIGGWPEVVVFRSTYWGLMDYDQQKAEYSPTSAFVLE